MQIGSHTSDKSQTVNSHGLRNYIAGCLTRKHGRRSRIELEFVTAATSTRWEVSINFLSLYCGIYLFTFVIKYINKYFNVVYSHVLGRCIYWWISVISHLYTEFSCLLKQWYNFCIIRLVPFTFTSRFISLLTSDTLVINPYPTAFPYGNGMVLHFYQQQESSTTKTVHKVINKGLKTYV